MKRQRRDTDSRMLLRRAVGNIGLIARSSAPRWLHVGWLFMLPEGQAKELCRELGLNPDEVVPAIDEKDSKE